jgi:hypothetical protein
MICQNKNKRSDEYSAKKSEARAKFWDFVIMISVKTNTESTCLVQNLREKAYLNACKGFYRVTSCMKTMDFQGTYADRVK